LALFARVLETHHQLEEFLQPEYLATTHKSLVLEVLKRQKNLMEMLKSGPYINKKLKNMKPTDSLKPNAKLVKQPSFLKKKQTKLKRKSSTAIAAVSLVFNMLGRNLIYFS